MSKQNLFSNLTKKDGKLEYNIKAQEKIYNTFVDDLPEGAKVEIFVSVSGDNGTNAQIAKVHVMIRQLANDIGYSFGEMKLQIKRKAGLCFNKNGGEYCKSFGDCSKDELNSVIQEIIELGDDVGSNLR
jgi:hypothetical protein|tara:strand:- start:658 stop:1044 length:387 start_codon:yes stop_codon:yes gene_type:complete